jgi:hypothetical protein
MIKFSRQMFLLATLALLATGCVSSFIDEVKRKVAVNEAAYQKRENDLLAQKENEKKNREARQVEINKGNLALPEELAIKLLVDTFTGSTCNEKNNVEIKITTAFNMGDGRFLFYQPSSNLDVFGTFRSVGPQGRLIETYLRGKFNLYGGFLSLHSSKQPTLKEYIEEVNRKKDATSQRMFEMASTDRKKLDEFEEKFGSRKLTDDGAHTEPTVVMNIDVARDAEGKNWVGSFEGDGYNDCSEIIMASKRGATTNELPPVTHDLAFRFATDNIGSNNSFPKKVYWLKVAESYGDNEASFLIGQTYEKMGDKSPRHYPQALQYYRSVAEKYNDSRAQSALGRMYKNGSGVAIDMSESRRWASLAENQRRAAGKICTSPKVREEALRLMRAESQDPAIKLTQLLGGMVGVGANFGVPVIRSISLKDLTTVNKPYTCNILAQNIGAYIKDYIPDFEYAGSDDNGDDMYVDRRLEQTVRGKMADLLTKQSEQPYYRPLSIEPKGNQDFKIILVPNVTGLSQVYSAEVNLR